MYSQEKNRFARKITAVLLLSCMVFSQTNGLVLTAHAEEGGTPAVSVTQELPAFVDLDPADPFYDQIMEARARGYTNGVGGNRFGVNDHVRLCDLITIIKSAFEVYGRLTTVEEIEAYTSLYLGDYGYNKNEPLTANDFFKALFCLYGIPENKVAANPDGYVGVARDLGLVVSDLKGTDLITRRDAFGAFMTLKDGQYQYLFEKQVGQIKIEAKEGTNLYDYYARLALVPESILRQFIADGWKIIVTDSTLYGNGFKAAGITNYANKTITVNQAFALVHEFGHYFDSILDNDAKLLELFKAEKDSAAEMIRDYTKYNAGEFFADTFAYWVENSIMFTRDTMEEMTPQTAAYFKHLDEQYHFDQVYAYTHEMRPVYDYPWHS